MESTFPLLTLHPVAARGKKKHGKNAPVDCATDLPRLRSFKPTGGAPLWVPKAMADAVPGLLALMSPTGDLGDEAWRQEAHAPGRLAEAAVFFQVPEADIARMLELAHHRSAVARHAPAIAAAIAADSEARGAVRAAVLNLGQVLNIGQGLRRVPLGQPCSPSPSPAVVDSQVPRLLDGIPSTIRTNGAERRFADAAEIATFMPYRAELILRELRGFNVFFAGGGAAQVVLPFLEDVPDQDVDIFVVGTDPEAGDRLVVRMRQMFEPSCQVYITGNAATFVIVADNEGPIVQVILRIYSCMAEALLGFDIAASSVAICVGESGAFEAWGTASFFAAAAAGAVWVDPERQSPSYAWRLLKYWARGFEVLLFGLGPLRRVSGDVFESDAPRRLTGLAEILRIEYDVKAYLSRRFRGQRSEALPYLRRLRGSLPESNYDETAPSMGALANGRRTSGMRIHGRVGRQLTWRMRAPGEQVTSTFDPRTTPFYTGTITARAQV